MQRKLGLWFKAQNMFYDDIGKKFIVYNTEFEVEEKELIDIFNLHSTFSHSNPNFEFFEDRSYNEAYHFYPILTNASSKEDEERKESINYIYHTDERVNKETSSLKTFSLFTLRSNISKPLEQSSKSSSLAPLVQGSKYVLYDDNGKKFIIDNADFEVEEILNFSKIGPTTKLAISIPHQRVHQKKMK
ncbi:hypothetical protein TNCV_1124971 [Trichonephila clavipes]|uniref:Uncharacterized protein n=1 Tax=Trichonephila clavipes TaxID=2585209 RepID=A0A8X6SD46_TRICX|nr:hypothetical protein TNCV_1124971 [Trichonephila clavipes]